MRIWQSIMAVALLTVACSTSEDETEYFELQPRTSYSFALSGEFADTLYYKNDTLQSWEYRTGTEGLTGGLFVNEVLDDFGRFNGYFFWTDSRRSYDEKIISQIFTQWDTTNASFTNETRTFVDTLLPFYGRLRASSIGFRNDTLKLMLSSANLQFQIDDQSVNEIRASAGYPVRKTVIEGHPDSTNFYYLRRSWDLNSLRIFGN